MRMRFWATIRSPAFSINALIAPVRLRAVASGLIIEKVRSIAMISSLMSGDGEMRRLYGRIRQPPSDPPAAAGTHHELQQFHEDEPSLYRTSGQHSRSRE